MVQVKVNARAVGTCPHCGVDVATGKLPEEKPTAAKRPLTKADVFFRFLMWVLGLSALLGIIGPLISK